MNYRQQLKNRLVKKLGEPKTLDELAWFVIKAIELYNDRGSKPKVVGFGWDVSRRDVCNSHDCPIDGVRNWGGREVMKDGSPAPRSYTGWQGRVWIRYSNEVKGFGSDPFNNTLTYPGTGGWGGYNGPFEKISNARFKRYGHKAPKGAYPEPQVYSWDYRFYEDDWPLVKDTIEKETIVAHLTGQKKLRFEHKFLWQDSDIVAADREFLEELKVVDSVVDR
jgi:hypothetical protein